MSIRLTTTASQRMAMNRVVSLVCLLVAAALVAPAGAAAQFQLVPDSFTADSYQADGTTPDHRAGGHPSEASTTFTIADATSGNRPFSGTLKDVETKLPAGFVGYPQAAPQCSRADFEALGRERGRCPAASQVGQADVLISPAFSEQNPPPGDRFNQEKAVFNLEPRAGSVAEFGFIIESVPVFVAIRVDPKTFGLVADVTDNSQLASVGAVKLALWGVPADASHDDQRSCGGVDNRDPDPCPVSVPRKPFLSNPTECGPPRPAFLRASSWETPNVFESQSFTPSTGVSGCDRLRFEPTAQAKPSDTTADASSGLSVELNFPQNDDPDGLDTPPLRTARVAFPEGVSVNPSSADGLEGCTDAQLGLGTDNVEQCSPSSKIGTATAISPSLENPLSGEVFVRTQASDDPASGDMFRLALVLSDPERGLRFKLPGSVKADPNTGRLTAEFADNPQQPVSQLKMNLKTGPRASLAMPLACGSKAIGTTLASWAGQSSDLTSGFTVGCPSGNTFAPTLRAGARNPIAGGFSPLSVALDRPEGQQYVDGLTVQMPTGSLAKLRGVTQCGAAAADAGNCPAASRVGSANVAAGSGTPFWLRNQPVYLAGPYKGAPFSLSVVTRAKAGPFDLGTIVVRQAIRVDPKTAQLTVVSDTLPTIVKGVPLRLRNVDVDINRPGFTLNPTSCATKRITSVFHSQFGATSRSESRFQVGNCDRLALTPKLNLALTGGKGQLTDGKHPGLKALLTQKGGQANLKKVSVKLPLSLALDPDNAQGLCEYADSLLEDPKCPKSSIVGRATATTPVLNKKLSGPVYFAKNIRINRFGRQVRTLPNLVLPLRGENGLKLNLVANSNVSGGKLVNTFNSVPDAPVSRFDLRINGGRNGILVANSSVCKRSRVADVDIDGHNNKQADQDRTIKASCSAKASKKSKKSRRR